MSEERLQKILARAGITSRRKAEELIREGLVTVNGRVAELGEKADPEHDAIKVDGKRIQPSQGHRYLLLNKPKGYMSTSSDPEGRQTVMDLVPPALRKALVPVGRLDFNTEGLLLLTDDGEFAQRIAHPRYGSSKVYEVKVKGTPTEAQLDKLRSGIVLEGYKTGPAKITSKAPGRPTGPRRRGEPESDNSWWTVEISEGRTRQIREMFHRVGHPVQKLRRVAIGPLRDARLPLGALRELTEQEVQKLLRSAQEKKPAAARKATAKKAADRTAAPKKPAPKKPASRKPAPRKAGARPAAKKTAARPRRPPAGVKRAGARKPKPQGRR